MNNDSLRTPSVLVLGPRSVASDVVDREVLNGCRCSVDTGVQVTERRNLVVCIDGTSNQYGPKNTNVIQLYKHLVKSEKQLTYYDSGIGTYAKPSWRSYRYWKLVLNNKIDLAIAWNFEKTVLDAYRWLAERYRPNDRLFFFGFSRGAFQVRALAAMIDRVGLIHEGNDAQIPFAYELYSDPEGATQYFKETFCRDVKVHFVGAWDTVSSIGFVRGKSLPGTVHGMQHVCYFRHALALDERRVKFLPEYAFGGATLPDKDAIRRLHEGLHLDQRVKEVWFSGTHSDIGGGNVLNPDLRRSGPPLQWMQNEAAMCGLKISASDIPWDWIQLGTVNESMNGLWRLFEYLPIKRLTYKDIDGTTIRPHHGAGRRVLPGQKIHASLVFTEKSDYRPKAKLPSLKQAGSSRSIVPDSWDSLIEDRLEVYSKTGVLWMEYDLRDITSAVISDLTSFANVLAERFHAPTDGLGVFRRFPRWTPMAVEHIYAKFHLLETSCLRLVRLVTTAEGRQALRDLLVAESLVLDLLRHLEEYEPFNVQVRPMVLEIMKALVRFASSSIRFPDEYIISFLARMLRGPQEWREIADTFYFQYHDVAVCAHCIKERHDVDIIPRVDETPRHSVPHPCHLPSGHRGLWPQFEIQTTSAPPYRSYQASTTAVAFSPDGERILAGSRDRGVYVWEAKSGALVAGSPFRGHSSMVTSVAFSPNGARIISGSYDCTIRLWNIDSTVSTVEALHGHIDAVWSVAYAPDGLSVLSGSLDNTVRLWDVQTGVCRLVLDHGSAVRSVKFLPSGRQIVSAGHDKFIHIWDANTGHISRTITTQHTDWIWSITISPNGTILASGSSDRSIEIHDISSGLQITTVMGVHADYVRSIAFSSDGRRLVSASDDECLCILDTETWDVMAKSIPASSHRGWVFSVTFSPDGSRIASSSELGSVFVWDAAL